jgi:uncharacterized protein YuzE
MCSPVIKIDDVAKAAYISLNKHSIARTIELTPQIFLDLDGANCLVGIEYLSFEEKFPLKDKALRNIVISRECREAIKAFEKSRSN